MSELLTAARMRAIEQAAITSGQVTGLDLMERAGRGVVEAIFAEWPELTRTPRSAIVLCGPGNNGGDGYVVARLLREAGWRVALHGMGSPDDLPPDARVHARRCLDMGLVIEGLPALSVDPRVASDLVIDALFGAGLARPLDGAARAALRQVAHLRIVSVDALSGTCLDSGRWLGADPDPAARPALTVTFHLPRIGHHLGTIHPSGALAVADIGLPLDHRTAEDPYAAVRLNPPPRVSRLGKQGEGALAPHKYTHGHALVLAGGPGKGGAARLAARGALRIGAGLVTLGCPTGALAENAAQLNAIMLKPLKEVTDLIELLADGRINAVCLGPGLGRGERAQQLVTAVLAAERATVLDADALTVHEDDPQSLFYQLHDACVLTPHAGEFRRLFPDIAERLDAPAMTGPAFSKVDATREAAARAGCTVLFKGPDTVIADASGHCAVNSCAYDRAAPWLATAGSGDVLAGFITGLLARGLGPRPAAEAAAWLHVEAARAFGPGLIAEDLPEELPRVFRALGL